ncbi:SRPBCC family protein [Ectothiorhodospiraceae bacterium 2226]|nr:SRPBCC family protein [Ectothiorhodospiraceae bacterium 2226]
MSTVRDSIEVNVPVTTAYNQWTQFEDFPKFMGDVEEVRQVDDKHLHWRAKVAGKEVEWDAEIIEQVPDQRIAWRSIKGQKNGGIVTFEPMNDTTTRVHVEMEYEPEGMMENVGDAMGMTGRRVHSDLEEFKKMVEERGATGAWRGEIH